MLDIMPADVLAAHAASASAGMILCNIPAAVLLREALEQVL